MPALHYLLVLPSLFGKNQCFGQAKNHLLKDKRPNTVKDFAIILLNHLTAFHRWHKTTLLAEAL